MKTVPFLLTPTMSGIRHAIIVMVVACCGGLLVSQAHAQRYRTQSPPTVITSSKLAFSIDLNGDTGDDIVIVDRATGTYRVGIVNGSNEFEWSGVQDTGMTNIETGAAGHFVSPSDWSLMLTSKASNRAQPVLLDGSDLPDSINLVSPEPQTLCALEPVSGGTTHFIAGYDSGGATSEEAPGLGCFNRTSSPQRRWLTSMQLNPRDATPIYGIVSVQPTIGLLADSGSGPGSTFIVIKEVQHVSEFFSYSSGETAGTIDALPANARFTSGSFAYDNGPIQFGYASATVLLWSPTDALLRTARVTNVDWDGNAQIPEGMSLLPKPTYNMTRLIKSVHVIETAGLSQLMVVWGDATGGASLFGFDGNSAPVFIENININGLALDGVMPSANGSTVFLGTRNGQDAWDRMHWDGTHLTRLATGAIPGAPKSALFSNIVAFSGEPFVNPGATELKRKRVRDWTTLASLVFGNANITSLLDGGAEAGLGNASVSPATFSGSTTNLLLSKLDGASSIAFLANSTSFTNNLPYVTITPAPGVYQINKDQDNHDIPLTLVMTATNLGIDDYIYYNINNTGWTAYQSSSPPQVSESCTVRAYASKFAFFGSGGNGPVTGGAYTLVNTLSDVQKQPAIDNNHNGLSDAWENLTGSSNPALDDDGDGFTNLQEHNFGTDPHNGLDHPGAVGQPLGLNLLRDSAPSASANTLRWSAADTAVILEGSDDVVNWAPVTSGIYQVSGENRYDMPTGAAARKFYRLRR